jgi:pyruvate-formate lyase
MCDSNRIRDVLVGFAVGYTVGEMEQNRYALLHGYREARELSNNNPVGEANGRNYIPIPSHLKKHVKFPLGAKGFADLFEMVMAESPVRIRPGERLVGDYYFLIPLELVEVPFPWSRGVQVSLPSGHTVGNIAKALELGWPGIRRRVEDSLERFCAKTHGRLEPGNDDCARRINYLESLLYILDVIDARIDTYADCVRVPSGSEEPEEAEKTAAILDDIRKRPPETFREALQWYWLYVTFERSTSAGNGGVKLDEVFAPFFERDVAAGRIDDDEARDLLVELFLKEGLFYCIGGTHADGSDATNRLSWLALEAYDEIGGPSNLNVRWHPGIDSAFFSYAVDVLLRKQSGVPNLVNDTAIVPSLEHYGIPTELARTYTFAGCFWYVIPGKEYPYHDMESIAASEILVATIESCRSDPPGSFDELLGRFFERQHEALDAFTATLEELENSNHLGMPEPVLSLVMDGTIERGADVTEWAEYSMITVLYVGLATVADSLNAIRSLVYEQRRLAWRDLFMALDANFEGATGERVRRLLLSVPKFGNDEIVADAMARTLVDVFCNDLSTRRNHKGFSYRPAFYSWNRHIYDGSRLGATPDGRKSGEPVSQGVNPAHGRGNTGITANLHSVSKLDLSTSAGAPVHLHVSGVSASRDSGAVESLVITAFEKGIPQVILNLTDRRILEEAAQYPERYWDLVVRVTGYSARFVQCSPQIQHDIITRTEYVV